MNDLEAKIDHMRIKNDRLRQRVRNSDRKMSKEDREYFRLCIGGFRRELPPPTSGECWEWQGEFSQSGKPIMRVNGKRCGALLASYATWIRPVKPEDVIRQTCNNIKCVNPAHLCAKPYGDPMSADWVDYHRPSSAVRREDHHLAFSADRRPWFDHP